MSASTQKCPACGAQTSGKFCSECGAPLGDRSCPSCGAKLSARAKFCPECGTVVAAGPALARSGAVPLPAGRGGTGEKMPWIVAGIAVLALVATIVVVVGRKAPATASASADGAVPFDPTRGTTDLSQMTPREQADRLYDRVARASESGDSQQVQFFGPMALQAYTMLGGTPDADARLHIGLIQLALNDPAGAAAQADTILRGSRTHLYGFLLKARAGDVQGNAPAARQAYQSFVSNYDAERAKNLPEYGQHAAMLDQTRTEAQRILGATGARP